MLARIRTNSPSQVSHIAEALCKRGYEVEIVSSNGEVSGFAEVEIAAEFLPAKDALAQGQLLAQKMDCDLLIAPGALDSLRIVQNETEPIPIAAQQPATSVPPARAMEPQVSPVVVEEPVAGQPVVIEDVGPDWTQRGLDHCAIALVKLRGLIKKLAQVAGRTSSRSWSAACVAGIWMAGKARVGGTKFGVASRNATASAGARWSEARAQYARVRAAATAKAAQMREERSQAKAAARNRVAVEVLGTTAPPQQGSNRGWRAALAGAAMAALVIGVGFSVGAGRTPAATPDQTQAATHSAPIAMKPVAPTISVEAPKPHATKASSPAANTRPRHAVDDEDSEQEVIVRHFAPVRSTPAVTADGVRHYSDTDQR